MRLRPAPLDAAALALSLALTAVFTLPRLPASADGLLPRRFGWALFEPLMGAAASNALRACVAGLACMLLLAAAAVLAWRVRARWGAVRGALSAAGRMKKAGRLACALAGLYLLLGAARLSLSAALDLLQNVFYVPEALSVAEPVMTWLAFFIFSGAALRAAAALIDWTLARPEDGRKAGRSAFSWAAALILPGLALSFWGRVAFDAGKPSLGAAVGLDLGRDGGSDSGRQRLDAVEAYARGGRSVYRRAALRFLYDGRAFEQDAEGLRRALLLGLESGDPLASALVLGQLACLPDAPSAHRLLAAASDESSFRVGPRASEKLALAHARLGRAQAAEHWRGRAVAVADAPPAGLLAALPDVNPRGVISGTITGARGRVGLYCRPDEQSPNAGQAQLAAAVELDAGGGFRVEGLPQGAYFLVIQRGAPESVPMELTGHRGDLVLTFEQPELSVSLRAR